MTQQFSSVQHTPLSPSTMYSVFATAALVACAQAASVAVSVQVHPERLAQVCVSPPTPAPPHHTTRMYSTVACGKCREHSAPSAHPCTHTRPSSSAGGWGSAQGVEDQWHSCTVSTVSVSCLGFAEPTAAFCLSVRLSFSLSLSLSLSQTQ
jgi:hypothetical protein